MLQLNTPKISLDTSSIQKLLDGGESGNTRMSPVGALCGCSLCQGGGAESISEDTLSKDSTNPQALTVPSTAPYYVQALDSGYVWANDGKGVVITYKFWDSLPSYYSSSSAEANNFRAFTTAQKEATLKIFDMLEGIANVTFVEASSTSTAQLGFAQANLGSGVGAWAYYPGTSGRAGDVWMNNYYSQTQTVTEGSYGFMVLAHETGHAMGLKHSFSGSDYLTGAEDSSRYTIMSYTWPFYPESYMIYDIAALQAKYGANMNHATGNDNYVLRSGDAYAIWDAGGVDTLDGSALTSSITLNMNAGTLSSVGKTNNFGIAYNVTIENAKGGSGSDTIYGNAASNQIFGNSGNDIIYGSAGNDMLDGGTGTDTVIYSYSISQFLISIVNSVTVLLTHALLGSDTLINIEKFTFGSTSYSLIDLQGFATDGGTGGTGGGDTGGGGTGGGDGDDIINGNGGYDKLYGAAGNDQIHGGSYADKIYGEDGSDKLYGYAGSDYLYGGAGADTLSGGDGYDKLYGDAGDDVIHGDASSDYLYGGTGNDKLYGDDGSDKLYGNEGDDTLVGGAGNDYLYGDGGNDVLVAGLGTDTLYGRAGSDTFAFDAVDSKADYIKDFTLTGAEADKLNITDILSGYDGSKDINDFVRIIVSGTSRMDLMINQDGAGSDWVKTAMIYGSNFSGVTADDMLADGQLIANQSVL
ncbi:MAG: M10 family metallopeptidase C-terminal domain-containing protein [Micavibrio aeruginosavorus]|nr:M10 family metallopeptidase C-terminal domain-containing protein [Micavibrio aeruginosavorus]